MKSCQVMVPLVKEGRQKAGPSHKNKENGDFSGLFKSRRTTKDFRLSCPGRTLATVVHKIYFYTFLNIFYSFVSALTMYNIEIVFAVTIGQLSRRI